MLLSCVRTSYQMENIADFSHYCDILMPYTVNYFSSRETILSAKMYFRHNLMSSVDHSTADAMKPSISKGYHLGSVNSSLVNLYLIPPFPSLSPSCVTLLSVSVAISIHQSSTDLHLSYLQHIHQWLCAHTQAHKIQIFRSVCKCCSASSEITVFTIFLSLLYPSEGFTFKNVHEHSCNWCSSNYIMLRKWKKQHVVSVSSGCVH